MTEVSAVINKVKKKKKAGLIRNRRGKGLQSTVTFLN